jgi:hypothetical protein
MLARVKHTLFVWLVASTALAQNARPHVVVGTHEIAPFVIHNSDGSWSGISIDLWRRITADRGYETELRDVPVAELTAGRSDLDVITKGLQRSPRQTRVGRAFGISWALFGPDRAAHLRAHARRARRQCAIGRRSTAGDGGARCERRRPRVI